MSRSKQPTVYQRIKRAYEKKRGIRLTAQDVITLYVFDEAIKQTANDDDAASSRSTENKTDENKTQA